MSWWFLAVATVWAMAPEDSDLDKARSAYWEGDYATALASLEPLAVSGNPTAPPRHPAISPTCTCAELACDFPGAGRRVTRLLA